MEIFLLIVLLVIAFIFLAKISSLKRSINDLTGTIHVLQSQVTRLIKAGPADAAKEPSMQKVSQPEQPSIIEKFFEIAPSEPSVQAHIPEETPEPARELESMPAESEPKPWEPIPEKKPVMLAVENPAEKEDTIFTKIWSWLLVGEEYRPKNVSMEYAVASTWLMRLGIIALVICVGFFLKWSIDKGLLGPIGRVALSVIAGIAMLVFGLRQFGRKYNLLGHGLAGGGFATLYFSMYAMGPMYHLVPIPACFGLMILITLTAGWLSVSYNSMLIAILGIIGGFCTPLFLRTPEPNLTILYSYMILLSIGILGIAHAKQWRLLNYLGFVLTWALFFGSLTAYDGPKDFPVAISFLSVLFLLHSAITYYYNLIRRRPAAITDIVHLFLNTALFASVSYKLIMDAYGRPWPAILSISLAVFFIAHVFAFLKSRLNDRNLLIAFIGVAGFFTAWAVPLITEHETITICWALQALFFVWMGLKLESNFLTAVSSILYCIVIIRLMAFDMPAGFEDIGYATAPMAHYWSGFLERAWTFGIVIASFFASSWLYKRKQKAIAGFSVERENDIPDTVPHPVLREFLHWVAVAFLFVCCYLELVLMFGYYQPLQLPVLTVLCLVLGLYLVRESKKRNSDVILSVACLLLIAVIAKIAIWDMRSWEFYSMGAIYRNDLLEIAFRLLDFAALFGMVLALAWLTRGRREPVDFDRIFKTIRNVIIFIYFSCETNSLSHWYLPDFQAGAISILWAVFAVIYLAFGIWKESKAYRFTGLVLFILVVAKVFFLDLSGMEIIYRVVAFMIVGLLLLAGSFAYVKASARFIKKEDENV